MADFDVGAKVDKQSFDKALDVFKKLKKEQQSFVKEQTKAGASSKSIAKGIAITDRELREQTKILKVLNPEWRKATKEVSAFESAVESLDDEVRRLNDQFDLTSQKVGAFGDIQSNLGAVSGLAGTAGLGGVSTGLGVAGEVSALAEELPRLKDAFKAAGPALQVTTEAIGLSGIASRFASVGLGATAASLAAIATVVLPLVAIGVALGAAFKIASDNAKELTEATRRQFEATIEVNDLLRDSETTQADFLEARLQASDDFQRAQENLAIAQDKYNQVVEDGGPFVKLLSAEEEELNRIIQEQQKEVLEAGARLTEYNEHVFDSGFAAADAAEKEGELTEARQTAVQEADRLAATIGQFESKRADLVENNAIKSANALELESLNQEFADEDQLAQEQDHQSKLLGIASDSQRKLEAISSELSALPSERLSELSNAESEGNAELNKARQDFFDKGISNLKKFQSATIKINDKTAKTIRRINEDTLSSTNAAARANDVSAFLRAQEQGALALERATEDATDTEKERVNNFVEAQQKEREAFAAKQADIQLAIQEERQAINESFSERREQLLETLATERKALDERTNAEIARFDAQEAREEQTAERAQRRADILESQQDAAAQRQAQRASLEQNQAEQAHARELAKIAEIDRAIQSIQPPPAATSGGGTSRSSRQQTGGSILSAFGNAGRLFGQRRENTGSRGGITPFHNGGDIEFPSGQQEGFILAKSGEIVIDPESVGSPAPFSNTLSGQNRGAGTGSMTFAPTIQISSTVGDIASRADVDRANEGLAMVLSTQLVRFFDTATSA